VRVLIDNCVPRRLADRISGHEVAAAVDLGWADLTNGRLLDAMAGKFDALITVDAGIPFQQRLSNRPFAIILLRARSNRLQDLLSLLPALLEALAEAKPGELREISV
jgi:predicted nuclease of predicted toxin-antitoxin system